MTSIESTFSKLKSKNEAALIAYIAAGDPTAHATLRIADALIKGGVDILELGLPFSDPIADGPTIQAASVRALKSGTTPGRVLKLASEIKQKQDIPVVIMTYYNPVFKMGLAKFFHSASGCGVDGLIVPDLPVEEAEDYKKTSSAYGIDTIFLAAPSTSHLRLTKIVEYTSGFLYLVSQFGVTGARERLEESTIKLVKAVLPMTRGKVPLAVGFGISKPEHVRGIVDAGADGVIVGSLFTNIISRNLKNQKQMLIELEETARKLKKSTSQ